MTSYLSLGTRDVHLCTSLVQCWASVADAGPTSNQCRATVDIHVVMINHFKQQSKVNIKQAKRTILYNNSTSLASLMCFTHKLGYFTANHDHFASRTLWSSSNMILSIIIMLLTTTTLKYSCINHGHQRIFQFEIIINVIVSSFRLS